MRIRMRVPPPAPVCLAVLAALATACDSNKTLLTNFVSPISIAGVSVTPPIVPPGGTTTIAVVATATTGTAIHYAWTIPQDWTVLGATDTNTLSLTAPHQFGAKATVALTADDGQGRSISTTIAVATTTDTAPTCAVAVDPSSPRVGVPTVLTAQCSAAADQSLTYAWTLSQAPMGSTATLSQAEGKVTGLTADLGGTYVAQVIATDEQGLASAPMTAVISVAFAAPTIVSVIANPATAAPGGTTTLHVVATSSDGHAPNYTWTLPNGWTAQELVNADTIVVVAPNQYGASAQAIVTVDDGHGQSTSASIPLATSLDAAPVVSVTTNPTNPEVGSPVQLSAEVSATAGRSVTYAWELRQAPNGSASTLAGAAEPQSRFTPDVPGSYVVRLTVTDEAGLSALTNVTVSVRGFQPPTITSLTASPAAVPPGALIVVSATATSTDGYGLRYAWALPTGWTAQGPTNSASIILLAPSQFSAAGLVTLTVDEGHGASASSSIVVRTTDDEAPTATISATPSAPSVGTTVSLLSQASAIGGQTLTYAWKLAALPQGSSATLTNPTAAIASFVPDRPGTYVASLIVTDASGLSSTPATTSIAVAGFTAPIISSITATPQTVAPGGLISVSASVASTDGFATTYAWTVPEGWTIVGPANTDSILVTAPQTYGATAQVKLVVDDSHGATDSATTLVGTTADTPPEVSILSSPSNPVIGGTVSLTSQVTTLGGQTATYAWSLIASPQTSTAALTSSEAASTTLVPDVPGAYTVQLIAIDASGLSNAATSVVTVGGYTAPVIQSLTATPATAPPGGALTLVAVVSSTDGFPLHYTWTLPTDWVAATATDGNSIGLTAPAKFGQSALVLLTVDEGHGQSATSSVIVATTADEAPTVSITASPTNPVISTPVNLTAHASVTGGQTVTYAWTLTSRPTGSNATIPTTSTATPVFTPDVAGTYIVSAVVTDASGLSSLPATATIQVTGYLAPVIQSLTATPPTVAPSGLVSITANVTSADGYPVRYTWSLPQGWTAQSALTGATIVAKAPALYGQSASVLLTADDGHGMSSSSSLLLKTTDDVAPTLTITTNPSDPYVGGQVTVTAHATVLGNQAVTYDWVLLSAPSGSQSELLTSTGATVGFTPDLRGSYLVQVVATDASGLSSLPTLATVNVDAFSAPLIDSLTVQPVPVTPGGLVTVTAVAQTTDAFGVNYAWTIPPGWTPISPINGDVIILSAPRTYGAQDQILLTVNDGHDMSATSSAVLETSADVAPVVTLTVSPSNPTVGTPVNVDSLVVANAGQGVTYSWTLLSAPLDATATLDSTTLPSTSLTPDLPGDYVVQLIATDDAGTASNPALVTVSVGFPAPVAVIAGTPPLKGVINAALKLDGSGSTNPAGNAMSFTWGFLGLPPTSKCSASCFTQGAGLGLENLTADATGLYSIQLTVKDVVTGLSSTATTTVKIDGPAQILIVSGNNQSGQVKNALSSPALVRVVASDGVTPIPNLGLTWTPANLTASPGATVTDTNGEVDATITLGRVAGGAKVTVSVTSNPLISKVLNFTATAQSPATRALLSTIGTTDDRVPITIGVVDTFGNPVENVSGTFAGGSVGLVLESPSGLATFSTSTTKGSISVVDTNPPRAVATLEDGKFVGWFVDPAAEAVIVSIVPGPDGANLPLAAWTTQLLDLADTPGKDNNYAVPTSLPLSWHNEARIGGGYEWNLLMSPGLQSSQAQIDLLPTTGFTTLTGSTVTLLNFTSRVQSTTTFDATGNCWAQPAFRVRLSLNAASPTTSTALTPVNGYEMLTQCGLPNAGAFFGASNTAVSNTVDITDKMNPNNATPPPTNYLDFMAYSTPDVNLPPPTTDAKWSVGDISVRALGGATYTGATSNATVRGGTAVAVTLIAAAAPAITGCVTSGPPPYTVMLRLLDANGNVANTLGGAEIDWSGNTGLISILNSPMDVAQLLPNGVMLQGQGQVVLRLTDSNPDTLTFTVRSSTLRVVNPTITVSPPSWRCHSTGSGQSWSDTTPVATYDAIQAVTACQTATGLTCAAGPNYAYPTNPTNPCSQNVWVFNTLATNATQCAGASTIPAGRMALAKPYSAATSTCSCGPLGEVVNVALTQGNAWQ